MNASNTALIKLGFALGKRAALEDIGAGLSDAAEGAGESGKGLLNTLDEYSKADIPVISNVGGTTMDYGGQALSTIGNKLTELSKDKRAKNIAGILAMLTAAYGAYRVGRGRGTGAERTRERASRRSGY